ncbi:MULTISPECIES: GNAT family N-acetyltransferase [unclassified Microcoleus]|uniref:GNAT family N-acetyltransferase n=1 Tax=unclassified Microcoleus TaxID=2642155 RepID=UPI002FD71D1E
MSNERFIIRAMTLADLELAIQWAATEGWNPAINDAIPFYAADASGFLIGEIDGTPISSISAVRYGDSFAFIGFYIVQPAWRGQGYGLQTWNAALKLVGDRPTALDAVLQQVNNYSKFGFKPVYRDLRYQGIGQAGVIPEGVVLLTDIPFVDVVNYDALYFPASRRAFINAWINHSEHQAYGMVQDGKLCGYGVIRPSYTGFRIGPLFANSTEIAERLFMALIARAENQPVFIDVPNINTQAIALFESREMQPISECVRMYTHDITNIDINHIFGLTTLELG